MRAVIKVVVMAHMEDDDAGPSSRAEAEKYQVSVNLGLVGSVTDRADCESLVKMLEGSVSKAAANLSLKVAGS